MAKTYALSATSKEEKGKGNARSLRRDGKLPAVVYGANKEPVKVTLKSGVVNVEYNKGHMFTTLCNLNLDGKDQKVLVRDIQLHPVSDDVIHVDFLRVTDKTKIAIQVPVKFIDEEECPGLVDKGTLAIVRHEVELVCSAASIPDLIEVSLKGKENGDSVNISDAVLPKGTKPTITDRDFTIATLQAPRSMEDIEAQEEEADAAIEASEAEPVEEEKSEEGE